MPLAMHMDMFFQFHDDEVLHINVDKKEDASQPTFVQKQLLLT